MTLQAYRVIRKNERVPAGIATLCIDGDLKVHDDDLAFAGIDREVAILLDPANGIIGLRRPKEGEPAGVLWRKGFGRKYRRRSISLRGPLTEMGYSSNLKRIAGRRKIHRHRTERMLVLLLNEEAS